MILSESEKNRIKGLYGLVTESGSSAPPDESVLLMKKNPFNVPKEIYDRLTNVVSYNDGTRRKNREKNVINGYSKDLQDGDVYVVVDENCLKQKILEKISKGLQGIVGKSFRGLDDTIYKIDDKKTISYEEIIYVKKNIFESIEKIYLPSTVLIPLKDTEVIMVYFPEKGGILGYRQKSGYRTPFELVGKETQQKISNYLNQNVKPLLHRNNLPDDCFEIREVKREKTDF